MRAWIIAACLAVPCLSFGAATPEGALVAAAQQHDGAAVRALIAKGAAVDGTDVQGMTALHWAVHHDDSALVSLLLARNAQVNRVNNYGVTPLAIACLNGNVAIVRALLKAGADASSAQPEGETVLMTAARQGSVDVVDALLAAGADPGAAESWRGQTALMWAAAEGHDRVVRRLLQAGAEVGARSKPAAGPPRRGARRDAPPAEPKGFTAVVFAVRGGHLAAARALLDAGVDVDEKTPDGNTLLHLAIANAHYELAALLVERGADVNIPAANRLTPLHHVVHTRRPPWQTLPPPVATGSLDSLELMKLLIAHGADPNARLTPLEKRPAPDDENIPPPGGGATPLWLSATGPDAPAMRVLLDAGADPWISTDDEATTLLAAAGIDYRQGYRQKMEPEVLEAVTLVLERGLDVNARDAIGNTPLHGAAMRGVNSVVKVLVAYGANLDARNKDGKTPFDMASDASDARSQPETAALLRELMASRSAAVR